MVLWASTEGKAPVWALEPQGPGKQRQARERNPEREADQGPQCPWLGGSWAGQGRLCRQYHLTQGFDRTRVTCTGEVGLRRSVLQCQEWVEGQEGSHQEFVSHAGGAEWKWGHQRLCAGIWLDPESRGGEPRKGFEQVLLWPGFSFRRAERKEWDHGHGEAGAAAVFTVNPGEKWRGLTCTSGLDSRDLEIHQIGLCHWMGITGKMDQRKELKMSLAMTWFRPLTAEVHNVSTWWVAGPGWGPRFPDTLCVFLTLSQGACPLLGGSARWTRALLGMQLSGEARLRQREDKPPPSFCPGKSRRTVFLLVGPETLLPPWDGVSGASPLWWTCLDFQIHWAWKYSAACHGGASSLWPGFQGFCCSFVLDRCYSLDAQHPEQGTHSQVSSIKGEAEPVFPLDVECYTQAPCHLHHKCPLIGCGPSVPCALRY